MINFNQINSLINFILENNEIGNKQILANKVKEKFNLTLDRKLYYCDNFAIRFSKASSEKFGNTVLSLSALQKYDDIPVIICVVLPTKNQLILANSTFLKKISHSSQQLRCDNIKGSFNGSDILRIINGIPNAPDNFEKLFNIHANSSFEKNLIRLVEATNDIIANRQKFIPNEKEKINVENAPKRSTAFLNSPYYTKLSNDLQNRVSKVSNDIINAAFIENVNIRGNLIEHLITNDNEILKSTLLDPFSNPSIIPPIKNSNDLGDYNVDYGAFNTKTDIKTKILFLSSNPKAYNVDKFLKFLSKDNSVYLLFFVGIDKNKNISTLLCPVFDTALLDSTVIIKHWAGRKSRGVAQFYGEKIANIINNKNITIDEQKAGAFLNKLLNL